MTVAQSAQASLPELAAAALRQDPERRMVEYNGRWHLAGGMRSLGEGVSEALAAAGLAPNEPVAFVPRNKPYSIAALLGLMAEGRDIIMIHAYQSPEAMAQVIGRLSVRALVAFAGDFTAPVKAAMAEKGMAGVELTDDAASLVAGFEHATGAPGRPHGDEPHFIVQTSGTTGTPKHYPLPYRLFHPVTLGASLADSQRKSDEIPALMYFPFANLSGLMNVTMTFASGQSAVLLDKFDVQAWRDYVVRFRPPRTSLPPVAFRMVLDAGFPREDLASLGGIATGSAAVDLVAWKEFEARYGVPVLLGYGATEFAGSATVMTADLHAEWGQKKFGSAGRPVPGGAVRTIDQETFTVNSPGGEGLIEVLLPWVSPDWIRTSDVGMVDEDGFLFIRGRADNAIMRGGFKIVPESVEKVLQAHPKVFAAAVVGIPDARLGQVPVAAVEAAPGVEPPTPEELIAHLRGHLLAPQIPTEIRIVETLPRTGSLKVAKGKVKDLFGAA